MPGCERGREELKCEKVVRTNLRQHVWEPRGW